MDPATRAAVLAGFRADVALILGDDPPAVPYDRREPPEHLKEPMARSGISERDHALLASYRAGASYDALAHQFGISTIRVYQVLSRHGATTPRRAYTPEIAKAVVDAAQAGMSYTEIAKATGVLRNSVSTILRRHKSRSAPGAGSHTTNWLKSC